MPGVIMMTAMFALFVIEMWLNAKTGGHSHGGPTGMDVGPALVQHGGHGHGNTYSHQHHHQPPRPQRNASRGSFETDEIDYEKKIAQKMYEENQRIEQDVFAQMNADYPQQSEMPSWFVVFYEQYVRQRLEMMSMIKSSTQTAARPISLAPEPRNKRNTIVVTESPYIDEEGQMVDPAVYRKMSLNITLLEGGILFHSVFVGMTISITIDGFIILLVAILFHQMFEGLGLGSRIAAVPYPKGSIRPWVLVVAFGTTAPIGQAIGLLARNSYDPNSAFGLIIVGVFNAM